MSTYGKPNEGDLPHWIPQMREILRKRKFATFSRLFDIIKKK